MDKLIKKFIVWYLCRKCNAVFEHNGKTVRVFTTDFYERHVREYFNAIKRSDNNAERNKRSLCLRH